MQCQQAQALRWRTSISQNPSRVSGQARQQPQQATQSRAEPARILECFSLQTPINKDCNSERERYGNPCALP